MRDEVYEREQTAYRVIKHRTKQLIDAGYEVRMYERPVIDVFELMFVGPVTPSSGYSHIETMRIPFQVIHMLMKEEGDRETWASLLRSRRDVDTSIYSFISELIGKTLGGLKHDDGNKGEDSGKA